MLPQSLLWLPTRQHNFEMAHGNARTRPLAMPAAAVAAFALLAAAGGSDAWAQQTKIWDIPIGAHVSHMPAAEFVDPSCGTNGGPPGLPLDSFNQFVLCPVEEATGFREIWFIYEDTEEYIHLARRTPQALSGQHRATEVLGQPVVVSFLVDGDGRVRGYRVFTDSRAAEELRHEAYAVSIRLMSRFGEGWQCADLPRQDGESPISGIYVKQECRKEADGRKMVVESRYFYRAGQQLRDYRGRLMVNEFESFSRLEVLQVEPLPAAALAAIDAAAPGPELAAPEVFENAREAFLAGAAVDCPGCDLAGADLRARDLTGADLRGANLAGAVLHRAILREADLSGADLTRANLNKANLTLATVRDAILSEAMLYQVDGARADFSGADLYFVWAGRARFTLTNFEGANLDLADLGEARMNDAKLGGATLTGADLNEAVLFRADLRGAVAESATFKYASMRDADLSTATLRDANLFGADLAGANLTDANFSGAQLQSAVLINTNQSGTIFSGAVMPDNSRLNLGHSPRN